MHRKAGPAGSVFLFLKSENKVAASGKDYTLVSVNIPETLFLLHLNQL